MSSSTSPSSSSLWASSPTPSFRQPKLKPGDQAPTIDAARASPPRYSTILPLRLPILIAAGASSSKLTAESTSKPTSKSTSKHDCAPSQASPPPELKPIPAPPVPSAPAELTHYTHDHHHHRNGHSISTPVLLFLLALLLAESTVLFIYTTITLLKPSTPVAGLQMLPLYMQALPVPVCPYPATSANTNSAGYTAAACAPATSVSTITATILVTNTMYGSDSPRSSAVAFVPPAPPRIFAPDVSMSSSESSMTMPASSIEDLHGPSTLTSSTTTPTSPSPSPSLPSALSPSASTLMVISSTVAAPGTTTATSTTTTDVPNTVTSVVFSTTIIGGATANGTPEARSTVFITTVV